MGQQKKEKLLEENFIKRCADTFADERGLVIPLEDSDLIKALEDYPNMGVDAIENILASKYEQIVFEKQEFMNESITSRNKQTADFFTKTILTVALKAV